MEPEARKAQTRTPGGVGSFRDDSTTQPPQSWAMFQMALPDEKLLAEELQRTRLLLEHREK